MTKPCIVGAQCEKKKHKGSWRRWGIRLAGATAGTAAAITLSAGAAGAAPAQACDAAHVATAAEDAQVEFVDQLNDLRRAKGLRTLAVNDRIIPDAVDWSATMSAQDWLHHARDHGPDDGVEPHEDYAKLVGAVVSNWSRLAENVGVAGMYSWCSADDLDQATQRAVDALHDAFVASSGHYKNMVGDFNQVGIGVHIDDDQLWVTVRFAKGDLPRSTTVTGDTADYIDAVHELFLGRSSTQSEKIRWASTVDSGSRHHLTGALAVSDEWAGVRVNDLYQTVLGRGADDKGRTFWVGQIAAGMRLEDAAVGFYGSNEYFARNGSDHRLFIEALYRDILGRKADRGGRDYWAGLLDDGKIDRGDAAEYFYASTESREDRVLTLYREILGRDPDTRGHGYWSGQLNHLGDVVLASQLASSQEFYNRSTR